MIDTITLHVLQGSEATRPRCGICGGPAAIELRSWTYYLHCTDEALERADIAAARAPGRRGSGFNDTKEEDR